MGLQRFHAVCPKAVGGSVVGEISWQQGVRQEEPLGPLLFTVSMQAAYLADLEGWAQYQGSGPFLMTGLSMANQKK